MDSPARWPQVGTRTPVLGHDGADLAAAIATIREIGDAEAFDVAVDDAFPGARVEVRVEDSQFETLMHQPGLLRPLLVLNEPESSLHPDLLPALARLILQAAKSAQVVVVSHASRLIAALEDAQDLEVRSVILEKELGETRILNLEEDEIPRWQWPGR